MKMVYGPVPSRRLGRSLGVNPIPFKTCNYSCVYCQLGRTTHMTNQRKDFFPPEEIINEIKRVIEPEIESSRGEIDFVTFVGESEPTFCKSLGWLIRKTKEMADIPIAVDTNGSLLYREDVRNDLLQADIIMPSLDAGTTETFRRTKMLLLMPVIGVIFAVISFALNEYWDKILSPLAGSASYAVIYVILAVGFIFGLFSVAVWFRREKEARKLVSAEKSIDSAVFGIESDMRESGMEIEHFDDEMSGIKTKVKALDLSGKYPAFHIHER